MNWVEPECKTCSLRKPPIGRSVAPEMANSMCSSTCSGFFEDPKPSYHWPNEDCDFIDIREEKRCLICWKIEP